MKTKVEYLVVMSLIGMGRSLISCERTIVPNRSTASKPVNSNHGQVLLSEPAMPLALTSMSTTIVESQPRPHTILKTVVTVSIVNIVINTFRPDPFLPPIMRLPRILLEAGIGTMASLAQKESMFWLILSLMTLVTAVMDIFVWGPIFAFFTSWQQCTRVGGWLSSQPEVCVTNYVMGSSRLLASLQSTIGGIFYLVVAVLSWGQFWEEQDYKRQRWQSNAMQQLMHQQHLWMQQNKGTTRDGLV